LMDLSLLISKGLLEEGKERLGIVL